MIQNVTRAEQLYNRLSIEERAILVSKLPQSSLADQNIFTDWQYLEMERIYLSEIEVDYETVEVAVKREPMNFWRRLHSFVKDVQVGCCAGDEEKQMILTVCKNRIKQLNNYTMNQPHYELRGFPGQLHYVLLAPENHDLSQKSRILGTSEIITSKQNLLKSVRASMLASQDPSNFEMRISTDNRHYFVLKAGNGEILITSTMYDTLAEAKKVKRAYCFYGATKLIVTAISKSETN